MPVATRSELEGLLADDVPYGDLTTESLGIGAQSGVMTFAARDAMTLALAEDAAAIIELSGCRVQLKGLSRAAWRGFQPIAKPDAHCNRQAKTSCAGFARRCLYGRVWL